jgi:antitoxin PrlF
MAIATVTSKGQVTIPKAVRKKLRLHTGDKLEFIITPQGETLLRPVTKRVDDIFGRLHRTGRKAVSVEEMDAAIQRRVQQTIR